MDQFRALLAELMAGESQSAFGRRTGIAQAELSRFLAGVRAPSATSIVRLMRAFPERQREILDAGLAAADEVEDKSGPDITLALYPGGDPSRIGVSA